MPSVIRIFMERDGMTKKEAIAYYKELREEIMQAIEDDCEYCEVEDILLGEGLEMDYIMDFI